MTRRPAVTLLLPNRNNDRVLELMLDRLLTNTTYGDFELVVVDDGSEDESRRILRSWHASRRFRDFTLIEQEHSGVVEALNAGLAAAGGELVVQLDGDATVETVGWLEPMVDFLLSDPRVGVVCPLVTYEHGVIHAAGVTMIDEHGLRDRGSVPTEPAGSRTLHTLVSRRRPASAGRLVTEAAEVDAAIGVCMLYRRDMAEALGGYDPGFSPVWFDDLDLSLAARRLGSKVFFVPGVEVVHRMSLRNDRARVTPTGRLLAQARSRVAKRAPRRLRTKVRELERRDTGLTPLQLRRLDHHYEYWRTKWGFDLLNPDMEKLRARYDGTEVCWAYDAASKAAGEAIAAQWTSARTG